MTIDWNIAYKKLMELLDDKDLGTYHSGTQFLRVVNEFSDEVPYSYQDLMDELNSKGRSTTRRDYYKDILMQLPEHLRIQVYVAFGEEFKNRVGQVQEDDFFTEEPIIKRDLSKVEKYCAFIQSISDSSITVPRPTVNTDIWNAERIKSYLDKMDNAYKEGDYGQTVTLAYTCLEGIFKAFLNEKSPNYKGDYLKDMAKDVREIIVDKVSDDYPSQMLLLISTIAYAISEARNKHSDSHFDRESHQSIALFCRDNANSVARFVLFFMKKDPE